MTFQIRAAAKAGREDQVEPSQWEVGAGNKKWAQMSSPWTQQAGGSWLVLELGSARVKQCLGTLVWLLYCLPRSRVIETNHRRKSCTHGPPRAFGACFLSLLLHLAWFGSVLPTCPFLSSRDRQTLVDIFIPSTLIISTSIKLIIPPGPAAGPSLCWGQYHSLDLEVVTIHHCFLITCPRKRVPKTHAGVV